MANKPKNGVRSLITKSKTKAKVRINIVNRLMKDKFMTLRRKGKSGWSLTMKTSTLCLMNSFRTHKRQEGSSSVIKAFLTSSSSGQSCKRAKLLSKLRSWKSKKSRKPNSNKGLINILAIIITLTSAHPMNQTQAMKGRSIAIVVMEAKEAIRAIGSLT